MAASEQELDATFAALADATRRAIVARLALGEAPVLEVARPVAMSQPAISKHLKVLERAGLISRRREAQRRLCRLELRRLEQLADWVGAYRRYCEESYSRLDDYLKDLQAKEDSRDHKKARSHRRPR